MKIKRQSGKGYNFGREEFGERYDFTFKQKSNNRYTNVKFSSNYSFLFDLYQVLEI